MRKTVLAGVAAGVCCAFQGANAEVADLFTINGYFDATATNQISARNVNVSEGGIFYMVSALGGLYNFSDTLNLTNNGVMEFASGLDYKTYLTEPEWVSEVVNNRTINYQIWEKLASNFVNLGAGSTGGNIYIDGVYSTYTSDSGATWVVPYAPSKLLVEASYIRNGGGIYGDPYGLVRLSGDTLDLSHGTIDMSSATSLISSSTLDFYGGWQDMYWGLGQGTANTMNPAALYSGGTVRVSSAIGESTSQVGVTNRNMREEFAYVVAPAAKAYQVQWTISDSNNLIQTVFVANQNPLLAHQVYAGTNSGLTVVWSWTATNWPAGDTATKYLSVTDRFGEETNFEVVASGNNLPNTTYTPHNYSFLNGRSVGEVELSAVSLVSLPNRTVTNQSSSYEAYFTPLVQLLTDTAGSATNLPGRIELTASSLLDLTDANISAPSYLKISAGQEYAGSQNAQISAPLADISLHTSSGTMTMTNIIAPYVNHLSGAMQMWSARWTNIDNGVTNGYHVFVINSAVDTTVKPYIQNLALGVTNSAGNVRGDLFIYDKMNVYGAASLDARSISIMTNDPASLNPRGELNYLYYNSVVPSETTPQLKFLTNWGVLSSYGTMYLGSTTVSNTSDLSATNPPLNALVNHGGITNNACTVWARYFENTPGASVPVIDSAYSFTLKEGEVMVLTNGAIQSGLGPISLESKYIMLNGATLYSAASIGIKPSAASWLSDGVPSLTWLARHDTNGNLIAGINTNALLTGAITNPSAWACSGLSVPVKPANGDLLGTTILVSSPSNQTVTIQWPGTNRGASERGFENNLAIGRLMLYGANSASKFYITNAPGVANCALYIDELDLLGNAADTDASGNLVNIIISPNVTVYFGLANDWATTAHIAQAHELNGQRMIWLTNYNYGYYSSTVKVYGDGSTNRVNTALLNSTTLDSNGNGTPNVLDPSPVPVFYASVLNSTNNAPGASDVPSLQFASDIAITMRLQSMLLARESGPFNSQVDPGETVSFSVALTNSGLGTTSTNFLVKLLATGGVTSVSGSGQNFGQMAPGAVSSNNFTFVANGVKGGFITASFQLLNNDITVGYLTNIIPLSTNIATVLVNPRTLSEHPGTGGGTNSGVAGSYTGLFAEDTNGVKLASAGFVTVSLSAKNTFSGKLQMAGAAYSFSGKLTNQAGVCEIKRGGAAPLQVSFVAAGTNDQLRGWVSNKVAGGWAAELVADRSVYSSKKTTPLAGAYTVVIPSATNAVGNVPAGSSVGTLKVSAAGAASWSGALADGTKFTQSAPVSRDGYFPLFATLYSGKGLAMSWLSFATNKGISGQAVWIKARGASQSNYPLGFTNGATAVGSPYAAATGLGLTSGTVVLGAPAGLSSGFSVVNGKLKSTENKLSVSFQAATGFFTGSVVNSSKTKFSFQGVILQNAGAGYGFFVSGGAGGSLVLEPAE
jgi:hypothetical protein